MDITSSTVLVVGGTSGLGLALARRLQSAGSTVVIGGRRTELLDEIAQDHGLGTVTIDVTDPDSIAAARDSVLADHPDLDTVVTMSGIMMMEDLLDPAHLQIAEDTVVTNLLGTIRVATAFTPHLVQRGSGRIITVSSGIAFMPFPVAPTYGATKAGVHSYSESLRIQLADSSIEVVELAPPYVDTGLMGLSGAPGGLTVDEFTEEAVSLLAQDPTPHEILVERVRHMRTAEADGTYDEQLAQRAGSLALLDR